MKKKYKKPAILKKEQNCAHAGKCGRSHIVGCGKLIVIT